MLIVNKKYVKNTKACKCRKYSHEFFMVLKFIFKSKYQH